MSRSGSKKSVNDVRTIRINKKVYKYSSQKDLATIAKKVNMPIRRIKSIIENQRRLAYNAKTGDIIPVNLLKDDVSGIIRQKFGIRRILKKHIFNDNERSILNKKI